MLFPVIFFGKSRAFGTGADIHLRAALDFLELQIFFDADAPAQRVVRLAPLVFARFFIEIAIEIVDEFTYFFHFALRLRRGLGYGDDLTREPRAGHIARALVLRALLFGKSVRLPQIGRVDDVVFALALGRRHAALGVGDLFIVELRLRVFGDLARHPLDADLARVRTLALRVLLREPGRLDELFFDDDLEIIQKFLIRAVGGTELHFAVLIHVKAVGRDGHGAEHERHPGTENAQGISAARGGKCVRVFELFHARLFLRVYPPREIEQIVGRGRRPGLFLGLVFAVHIQPVLSEFQRPCGRIGGRPQRGQFLSVGKHRFGSRLRLRVQRFGKIGHILQIRRPIVQKHSLFEKFTITRITGKTDDVGAVFGGVERHDRRVFEIAVGIELHVQPVIFGDVRAVGIVRRGGRIDPARKQDVDLLRIGPRTRAAFALAAARQTEHKRERQK